MSDTNTQKKSFSTRTRGRMSGKTSLCDRAVHGYNYLVYHARPKDLGFIVEQRCPNCHEFSKWHLTRYRSWILLFVFPLFPYRSDYYLRCQSCEHDISLSHTEQAKAKKLLPAIKTGNINSNSQLQAQREWFKRRIQTSTGEHINTEPDAPWTDLNDQLCLAIETSLYQPATGLDNINEILMEKVNLNARNSRGQTVLDIARYQEAPRIVLDVLLLASNQNTQDEN